MGLRYALVAAALGISTLASAQSNSAQSDAANLLAGGCMSCHGVMGQGGNGVPAIMRTQSRTEFTATMAAFRANERANTIMGRVGRGYTDAEIALLAAHYGTGN